MLNKFYKIINNKYSRFFRFIFFLRYLFAIFFISIALFLIIPTFFDHEKRSEIIKNQVLKGYNIKLNRYEKIKFVALPIPNIEFENALINIGDPSVNLNIKSLKIYPKLFSIYNYKNFYINKISIKKADIKLEASDFDLFTKNMFNQNNKISIENLFINVINKNKTIINFENLKYSNFGYNKDLIFGKIFEKNFKIKIDKKLKRLNLKFNLSGINAEINFDSNKKIGSKSGIFKSKILNTNIKFNFVYTNDELKIYNSYFRNNNFSFNNESQIILNPFLEINSKFNIEEFNTKQIQKIDFIKILELKNFIKKINSKNEIKFKSKKFAQDLIEDLNIKVDLAYGRLDFLKKFSISKNHFICDGNINLLEDFPLLFFNCDSKINDKKKLLKKLSIKLKDENNIFEIKMNGNLNILNKKINFKNIFINNKEASNQDLQYFKLAFENILFDEGFIKIFNLKKIKNYILEVS